MNALVTNLLDMARLEAGSVRLNRQWRCSRRWSGAALRRVPARAGGRIRYGSRCPPTCRCCSFDAVLIERLFSNLLENAAKYTPPGTRDRDRRAAHRRGRRAAGARLRRRRRSGPAAGHGGARVREVHARREGVGEAGRRSGPGDLPRDRRGARRHDRRAEPAGRDGRVGRALLVHAAGGHAARGAGCLEDETPSRWLMPDSKRFARRHGRRCACRASRQARRRRNPQPAGQAHP